MMGGGMAFHNAWAGSAMVVFLPIVFCNNGLLIIQTVVTIKPITPVMKSAVSDDSAGALPALS